MVESRSILTERQLSLCPLDLTNTLGRQTFLLTTTSVVWPFSGDVAKSTLVWPWFSLDAVFIVR